MPESSDTPNANFLKPEGSTELDLQNVDKRRAGVNHQLLAMSSREIADLTGKEHRNVLRDIRDMLVQLHGETGLLNFEHSYLNAQNKPQPEYLLPKRETLILVSGYSVDLRAKIIDRWQDLEAQQQALSPILALNDPGTLRALLLDNVEERMKLAQELAAAAPKLEAFERIASAEGSLCITDAAKSLQVRPKSLFDFLRAHGWIYQPHGGRGDIAYAPKLQQGLMEHKTTTVHRSDGSEKIITQARITPKGLARLAQEFPPPVKLAA